MSRVLSDGLRDLQARFHQMANKLPFGIAAPFDRDLRSFIRMAQSLEDAKQERDELLEIASDIDAVMVDPPDAMTRALRSGRSRDLAFAGDTALGEARTARTNPVASAAADIPGTNVTIFPVVPRPIPAPTGDDGGNAA